MKCNRCGDETTDQGRFCASCGNPLVAACAACGYRNLPGARFCGGCGLHLGDAVPDGRHESSTGEVWRAEGLDRRHVEGERKWVTVLFADIKGSLALIDRIDADAACAVLDGSIEIMVRAIRRHEGTVNRVLGDGIMAIFGAPCAREDHAVRGCHAASAILVDLECHRAEVRARHGVDLELRIGLGSGEVVVRAVHGSLAIPYDVIGTAAHLASRMEQLAPPGAVWLTEDTARLAQGFVDLRRVGPVTVKGLTRQIEVFELDTASPSRRAFDVALARGLGRLVGRQAELRELRAALAAAEAGDGAMIALVGAPGIGKSRLSHEFVEIARRTGPMVLDAASSGFGAVVPWQTLAGLLRRLFEIEADDGAETVGVKLREGLGAIDVELVAHATAMGAALDALGEADPDWHGLEPASKRARIHAGFLALLGRLRQDRPLIVVLEDLHDSDAQSIALLDQLARRLAGQGLLLLVTYRPEFRRRWPPATPVREIQLGPLDETLSRDLLDGILGGDPGLTAIKGNLATRAEGNPFFLQESVRHLVDFGVLAGSSGAYHLAGAVPDQVMPPTVQAAIEARIDRLAFEDKRLLRTAAVIGDRVDVALLDAVAGGQGDGDLDGSLGRLAQLEFLDPFSSGARPAHRFRHALVREVAYRSLPGWQRRTVHRRIVDVLTSDPDEGSVARLAALADHALKGELWLQAHGHAMELGQRALAQSASGDALAACAQAETALGHLEGDAGVDRARIDLRFTQIEAHFACGEHHRVADEIEEAYGLAERLGDNRRLLRASSLRAFRSWLRGEMDDAVAAGRQARSIAMRLNDLELGVNTAFRAGVYLMARGDYRAAVEPFEWIIDNLPDEQRDRRFGLGGIADASARAALARTLAELLEFDRARALAADALTAAERVGHPFSLVYVAQEIGILHLRTGELAAAVEVLSRGYQVALQLPLNLLRPAAASELGAALVESGRIGEGLELLAEALACARALDVVPQYGQQLGYLARAQLLAGHWDKANALAEEALGHALRYGERGDEAWLRFLLAQITEQRRPEDAGGQFAAVRRLACRRGLWTLEERCRQQLDRDGGVARRTVDAVAVQLDSLTTWGRDIDEQLSQRT